MYYSRMPETALARVVGGPLAPNIKGEVYFQDVDGGVMVTAYITGLPEYVPGNPPTGPFGFHIHNTGNCSVGDNNNPFQAAGEHYNPTNQPHGNHAGDLPVLFSNKGIAYMTVFTDKFKVSDVIGKSVIIHQNPDDFRSQPAGNSGKRLACGVIEKIS